MRHTIKYNAQQYAELLAEFQDLINSDPDFNYSYSEFDDWIREVVQADTGDYAHCADCDRVIDLDNDLWTADKNDTYCDICTKERKIIARI